MGHDYEAICYIAKREDIKRKDINKVFGNIKKKHEKIVEFMHRSKTTAKVISIEDLGKHDVALFQCNQKETFQDYSLCDIMVDFTIDRMTGEVTVKKLLRWNRKWVLETRKYYTGNYGKTWRAWTALPNREKAKWEVY